MNRLFVRLPALPLAGGAVAGVLFVSGHSFISIIAGSALLLLSIAAGYVRRWRGIAVALGACAVAGAVTFNALPPRLDSGLFEADTMLAGTVNSVRSGNASRRVIVAIDSCGGEAMESWRLGMLIPDLSPALNPGDRITFKCRLISPGRFRDVPFMNSGATYTLPDRISAEAVVQPEEIRTVIPTDDFSLMHALRERILGAIYGSTLHAPAASLLAGAWLGADNAAPAVRERFRAVGLSHLLCVSGYHVAVVAWLVALILYPLRLWTVRGRIRYALTIAAVWAYAALAGFSPSVIRAAVMLSAFLLGRLIDRSTSPVNTLMLAAAAVLFINPLWLYSIGFQLSFAAVASLIVFADKLNPVSRRRPQLRNMFAAITVPVAATLGTAPVILYHFHSLPLATIPVNILATAIFPLFMIGGAILTVLNTIGLSAGLLSFAIETLYRILDMAGDFLGAIPTAKGIYLSATSLAAIIAAVCFLGFVVHASTWRRRYAAMAACFLCMIGAACSNSGGSGDVAVLHSSRRGLFVSIVADGHGYIIPARQGSARKEVLSDFFEGHGIGREDVMHIPGNFSHQSVCRRGDTLIAKGRTILLPSEGIGTPTVDGVSVQDLHSRAMVIRLTPSLK